eukprot:970514-Pyramimonas_sp.AAC.1
MYTYTADWTRQPLRRPIQATAQMGLATSHVAFFLCERGGDKVVATDRPWTWGAGAGQRTPSGPGYARAHIFIHKTHKNNQHTSQQNNANTHVCGISVNDEWNSLLSRP